MWRTVGRLSVEWMVGTSGHERHDPRSVQTRSLDRWSPDRGMHGGRSPRGNILNIRRWYLSTIQYL